MSFALNFFRQVASEKEGNLFISSASVLTAMAIATAAADGNTETELSAVLDLTGSYEQKHASLGSVCQLLQTEYLSLANRFYVNDEFDLKAPYSSFVSDVYQVKVSGVDVTEPESEAARINLWVEKKTNDKIKDIIKPSMIDGNLFAFLINAIAYKGEWINKFDKSRTSDAGWTLPGDEGTVQVPRMHKTFDEIPYKRSEKFHSISLDLQGDVAMVLVLPTNGSTLNEVIATISEEDITSVPGGYKTEVVVGLTKWQFGGTYSLVDTFKALGVNDAFSDSDANFSRMADRQVYISDIIHKTFIKVDEEGAEMAAATVVKFALECCSMPLMFLTEQPFIYFAVDKNTKTILFSGRCSDPRKTE